MHWQVMKCRRENTFGETNPDPFPLIWTNCIGWGIYGTAVGNPFVFASNFCGILLGCMYVLSAHHLVATEQARARIESMTLGLLALWVCVG